MVLTIVEKLPVEIMTSVVSPVIVVVAEVAGKLTVSEIEIETGIIGLTVLK